MKLVIQRVHKCKLLVDNEVYSEINKGIVVFVGFNQDDTNEHFDWFVNKICGLRIFRDENDKINLSVKDVEGEIMIVSNFTLFADCSRGFRPNFMYAMGSEKARAYYEELVEKFRALHPYKVVTGKFGEHMDIIQENDGPINIVMDEREYFKK